MAAFVPRIYWLIFWIVVGSGDFSSILSHSLIRTLKYGLRLRPRDQTTMSFQWKSPSSLRPKKGYLVMVNALIASWKLAGFMVLPKVKFKEKCRAFWLSGRYPTGATDGAWRAHTTGLPDSPWCGRSAGIASKFKIRYFLIATRYVCA